MNARADQTFRTSNLTIIAELQPERDTKDQSSLIHLLWTHFLPMK